MKVAFTVLLALHGLAHLVGFLVPWRFVEPEDGTYGTTLLSGRIDVGGTGIRLVGCLWLGLAIGFGAAAYGLWTDTSWWLPATGTIAGSSLLLSILNWPESKIGVPVNSAILVILYLGNRLGWF